MARPGERGSQVVELALVLLPLCALVFLILDIAWAFYVRATLQNAVREGVRYAVTSQTMTGMGQDASIKATVQQNAMGLLSGTTGAALISIQYYLPNTLAPVSGLNSNQGGNIVDVYVQGYSLPPLGPILRSPTPLSLGAQAFDRMEGSPGGVPPAR
ncbi:MAG TPA: TadE family protein [Bryobacteraceae bacterium]|jgi:Flp pilus assembly protein TadG|nr:TadE family protein [Bryobacteraceae bacterium]